MIRSRLERSWPKCQCLCAARRQTFEDIALGIVVGVGGGACTKNGVGAGGKEEGGRGGGEALKEIPIWEGRRCLC
jgi:hypothetical protein